MLRTKQTESYWTAPSKQSLFREAFGLPDEETPLAEVHAVLSLEDKPEAYVSLSLSLPGLRCTADSPPVTRSRGSSISRPASSPSAASTAAPAASLSLSQPSGE